MGEPLLPQSNISSIPSRESLVRGLQAMRETAATAEIFDQEATFQRLVQILRNRRGRFGLMMAVCNEPQRQREISQRLIGALGDQRPVELHLSGNEPTLLDTLLSLPASSEPLIVYGIERLLPTGEAQRLRRQQTLAEMQLQRERFRQLRRPLLLWVPEYAYALIGQQAVDFWSWQGSGLFFTENRLVPAAGESIQAPVPQISARRAVRTATYDFIGRERHVLQAMQVLQAGQNLVLFGMAGIGKSELALLVAERSRELFPDGQFFLSFANATDTASQIENGLRSLVRAFDPSANLDASSERLIASYRSLVRERRVLIVLDDVSDERTAREFLPPEGSALIITSRRMLNLPNTQSVALGPLTAAEGRILLQSIAPRIDAPLADQFCALCGYLPLAIQLVGGLLNTNSQIAPDQILEQLRAAGLSGFASAEQSISASLELSYAPLSATTARVFRALAIFPSSFDAAAEAMIGDDADNAALTELVQSSLVRYDEALNRYDLHPLVRSYAESRSLSDERASDALRHAQYYAQVLEKADDLYDAGNESVLIGLALFDSERHNVEAGQRWAAEHFDLSNEARQLCSTYARVGISILFLRLHPKELVGWLESGLSAARSLSNRRGEGAVLGNLGLAYADLGDVRGAIGYHEQALAISREIGDRRGEGADLGNLGLAYAALGDVRGAIGYHEQALAISREIGDRRGEGNRLGNLGLAYADLGDVRGAIGFYEQAANIFHSIEDKQGESRVLQQLKLARAQSPESMDAPQPAPRSNLALTDARLTYSAEQAREALPELEQSLVASQADAHQRSAVLAHLGAATAALERDQAAIEHYRAALAALDEQDEASGDAAYAVISWQLGQLLAKHGEWAEAIAHLEERVTYEHDAKLPTAEYYEQKLQQARRSARAAQHKAAPEKRSWLDRVLRR